MKEKNLSDVTVGELLALLRGTSSPDTSTTAGVEDRMMQEPVSGGRLIPVTEWNKHPSWPPLGGLRWLIFNEHTNGFARVVRRMGRRVLIDEDAFFEWVRDGARKKAYGVAPSCESSRTR